MRQDRFAYLRIKNHFYILFFIYLLKITFIFFFLLPHFELYYRKIYITEPRPLTRTFIPLNLLLKLLYMYYLPLRKDIWCCRIVTWRHFLRNWYMELRPFPITLPQRGILSQQWLLRIFSTNRTVLEPLCIPL